MLVRHGTNKRLYNSPVRASYGASFVSSWEKKMTARYRECAVNVPCCTYVFEFQQYGSIDLDVTFQLAHRHRRALVIPDCREDLTCTNTHGNWSRLLREKIVQSSLQWRRNERDGVSNHKRLGCLLNRLFRRRSKKTSKLRVTGLCEGNSQVTGEFPVQRNSNAENVSIWWCHHVRWKMYRSRGVVLLLSELSSSSLSAAYMRQWTGSSLVQVMACRLLGAKPFPEPMLGIVNLTPGIWIGIPSFHSTKCIWKSRLSILRPFCPGWVS